MRTLLLSPPKGGSKTDFSVFPGKNQFQSNKVCYKVSLCENFQRQSCRADWAVNQLHEITEKYITERVPFHLKYWLRLTYPVVASTSTMHAVRQRVSKPRLRYSLLSALPNDVISKLQCGQLHNKLFRRRHSTLQPHGLFALATRLFHMFTWYEGLRGFSVPQ